MITPWQWLRKLINSFIVRSKPGTRENWEAPVDEYGNTTLMDGTSLSDEQLNPQSPLMPQWLADRRDDRDPPDQNEDDGISTP
jgi:hypothetical protein